MSIPRKRIGTPGQKKSATASRKTAARLPIRDQVSAGGVVFRSGPKGAEVVITSVGPQRRWQLPKGLVDPGEKPEVTAVREAREEAGVNCEIVDLLETIEYWYAGLDAGERVRFHKRVHFFLLRYLSGDTRDHDWEVNEARWVPIDEAIGQLAFENERRVVEKARTITSPGGAGRAER